eukprot:COSAG02_NODE_1536_length_12051_cov_8.897674_3_plen_70_part_00
MGAHTDLNRPRLKLRRMIVMRAAKLAVVSGCLSPTLRSGREGRSCTSNHEEYVFMPKSQRILAIDVNVS